MNKDQLKQAAADAATKATEAEQKAKDAGGTDEALTKAATDARAEAVRLADEAEKAPSHPTKPTRLEKLKFRKNLLEKEIKRMGGADDEDDAEDIDEEDDAEEEDEDRPMTMRDFRRLNQRQDLKTAEEMATGITDTDLQAAVIDALKNKVAKNGTPEERYEAAVAIASAKKNTKVAQEIKRIGGRNVQQHGSGGGAPPKDDTEEFTPNPLEAQLMRVGKVTKEDVLAARKAAQTLFPNK